MNYKIIDVKERLLADNDRIAAETRAALARRGVLLVNLMGSPGAGKTSTLLQLIRRLGGEFKIGVMEADVDSDVDARAVSEAGAAVIQLHTGGLCHMDAAMTAQGLEALEPEELDLVFLENVGNLVCPAEFDVGAGLRMMILSVPEGDDKPLKYPLMFTVSDLMLVNKMDAAAVFDFDPEAAAQRARALNPNIQIFPVSAKTGKGFDALADWLRQWLTEGRRRD
ncbi:MAG: hydrogenase nickel incorporation protein HypB [Oscillospiraceae bacterium]|nr:hydrogenase nickel incorporation protein HypB [Oscillospiraceae bacterium]